MRKRFMAAVLGLGMALLLSPGVASARDYERHHHRFTIYYGYGPRYYGPLYYYGPRYGFYDRWGYWHPYRY